jgi:MFS family permease
MVAVIAATFAYFVGFAALIPTLPRYVETELGGGGIAVGVALGAFAVSAALLRPWAGRWGDVHGRRVLVVGGSTIAGVTTLVLVLTDGYLPLVGLRFLTGIGEAMMFVGAATAVQDMAPPDRRGEAASYFSLALYGGLALGPALGDWVYGNYGANWLWIASGGLVLVGAALGLLTPQGQKGPVERRGLLHPVALAPGVILLLALMPFTGFAAFLPLYADEVDLGDTGKVFFAYAGVVLVIRFLGARIPDVVGWRRTSTVAIGAVSTAALILALWASVGGVWASAVVMGLGMSLIFPALFSAAVNAAPDSERSQAVGTFSLFFDLSQGLGAPFLGLIVSIANERAAFAASAFLALGGLALLPAVARRLSRSMPGSVPGEPAPISS